MQPRPRPLHQPKGCLLHQPWRLQMATAPKGAKAPQDHKAAKAEAENKDITFEWNERDWIVPREAFDNVELFEAIEDEKYLTAVRGYLGRTQWSEFKDSVRDDAGRVPTEQFESFLNTLRSEERRVGNEWRRRWW